MKRSTKLATAVTSATLLSLGLAGPALATATGTSAPAGTGQVAGASVTVADLQAWITRQIDARLAWVDKVQAMVSASTQLSAQRKADITAKLTQESATLVALKSAVAAATTKAAVWTAVDAASARGELFLGHVLGRGHHVGRPDGAWRCGDPANKSDSAKTADPAKTVDKAVSAVSRKARPAVSTSAGSARFGTRSGWQTVSYGHGQGQHSGHNSMINRMGAASTGASGVRRSGEGDIDRQGVAARSSPELGDPARALEVGGGQQDAGDDIGRTGDHGRADLRTHGDLGL